MDAQLDVEAPQQAFFDQKTDGADNEYNDEFTRDLHALFVSLENEQSGQNKIGDRSQNERDRL